MSVKVKIDKPRAFAVIKAAGNAALTDVRDEIIEDMNQYVPRSGGQAQDGGGGSLRNSAVLHSDRQAQDEELTVRWDTPYAQYQHGGLVMHGTPKDRSYGPEKLKYTDAMARAEWGKYAEQRHQEEWAVQIEAAMKKHL